MHILVQYAIPFPCRKAGGANPLVLLSSLAKQKEHTLFTLGSFIHDIPAPPLQTEKNFPRLDRGRKPKKKEPVVRKKRGSFCQVNTEMKGGENRRRESTNRLAMATFWRTFHHDGKIQPRLVSVGCARPPPFTLSTITDKVVHSNPASEKM